MTASRSAGAAPSLEDEVVQMCEALRGSPGNKIGWPTVNSQMRMDAAALLERLARERAEREAAFAYMDSDHTISLQIIGELRERIAAALSAVDAALVETPRNRWLREVHALLTGPEARE
jgi:hypothetical protein